MQCFSRFQFIESVCGISIHYGIAMREEMCKNHENDPFHIFLLVSSSLIISTAAAIKEVR